MRCVDSLLAYISKGNKRSVKAKKNVLASVLIKGADTLVYLLLVPVTLGYLNAYEYGIWLTLSSILSWFNSFDIGLGSGLRNKLGEAMANDDKERGRAYVSTTFFMLVLLTGLMFAVFSAIINYIDWYSLLNVERDTVGNLREVIIVSFLFFCISFLFKFVGNVYQALQLPAVNNLMVLGAHVFSLVIIFILRQTIPGSLFWVAAVYSAAMPAVYLVCYPVTFMKLYPYLAPSYRYFRKEYLKELFSLSILFFILQVMGIVLFSLSNLIISNLFGPDQVTPYNIAYRYFSIVLVFANFILAPLWSAATDAYAKNDMQWIKSCMMKMNRLFIVVAMVLAIMLLCSNIIFHLWVGDAVCVPYSMSLLMAIYVLIIFYSLCYSTILNGMGLLFMQSCNIIIVSIIFIPLCLCLSSMFGINGIVMAMCLANVSGALLNTVQLNKILKGSCLESSIWLK